MTEAMWMDKYELISECYLSGEIDRAEAEAGMRDLGFTADELIDHLDALDDDRTNTETDV